MAKIDDKGREVLDPTPLAVSVKLKRPPTLAEQVRLLMSQEAFRRGLHQAGAESFEEADDFDCDEDYDPRHPWERNFDSIDDDSPAERDLASKRQAAEPPSPTSDEVTPKKKPGASTHGVKGKKNIVDPPPADDVDAGDQ